MKKWTVTIDVELESRYKEVAKKRIERLLSSKDKQWVKDTNMKIEVGPIIEKEE